MEKEFRMRILSVSAQRPDSTGSGVYLTERVRGFAALGCEQAVLAGVGPEDVSPFPADVAFFPVRYASAALPFPICGMSDEMPYRSTRYCDMTEEMTAQFRAAFSAALRDAVDQIYRDRGFEALRRDVEEMRVAASDIRSLTVGINVNERFEAVSLGLVSVNAKPFTRSNLLKNFLTSVVPRDEIRKEADWNGSYNYYPANTETGPLGSIGQTIEKAVVFRNPLAALSLARIPAADGSGNVPRQMDSAASMLTSRIARKLRDTLGQYLNVSVKEMADLIPELAFYTRWAEYIEKKQKEGWHFCKPQTRLNRDGAAGMEAEGLYNLKLIATGKPESVVPNNLVFDREKRVYVLTGANRGGKTTVTQAVGQLFILAQSGIPVPADRFSYDPADSVLTHFPADEDKTLDLGRLGEECRRFRELFVRCTPDTLLLLNETFATTSFEEGYFIAADAMRAILDRGTRTIYNTHMHKLAQDLDMVINTGDAEGKAVSLVAETKEGKHSFRVIIAPPEGQSFARDIAEKYGVTYESLNAARETQQSKA